MKDCSDLYWRYLSDASLNLGQLFHVEQFYLRKGHPTRRPSVYATLFFGLSSDLSNHLPPSGSVLTSPTKASHKKTSIAFRDLCGLCAMLSP